MGELEGSVVSAANDSTLWTGVHKRHSGVEGHGEAASASLPRPLGSEKKREKILYEIVIGGKKVMVSEAPGQTGFLANVWLIIAVLMWVGIFHFNTFVIGTALVCFPRSAAVATLLGYLFLVLVPVDSNSSWGRRFAYSISATVPRHFPLKILYEEYKALDPAKAYVVALEPHSVLPLSAIGLSPGAGLFKLHNIRILGSSALSYVPICRHLWRWMGMAGASRQEFATLLAGGTSCCIIPGGVQECLYMNSHQEVLFLKKRRGFIRMAISTGCPLLPVFCFGQRSVYKFWRPRAKWLHVIARQLRFAPMLFWGMWGSPIPFPTPMAVVVGTPIQVEQQEAPSEEAVTAVHEKFLAEVARIYRRYQGELGAHDIELVIL